MRAYRDPDLYQDITQQLAMLVLDYLLGQLHLRTRSSVIEDRG